MAEGEGDETEGDGSGGEENSGPCGEAGVIIKTGEHLVLL